MLTSLLFAQKYWKIMVVAAAVLAVWGWHTSKVREARHEGYTSAIADVNAAARKLEGQANAASVPIDECARKGEPWVWNREKHTCEQ